MQTQTSLSSQLTARERGITTALLGLGLITFAIDASNTTLILPQIMTSLRVEVYQIHWVLTAPGIVRTVVTAATGWLSGRFGPRTLYLLCIGSMTVGSLGSMLAWDWALPDLLSHAVWGGWRADPADLPGHFLPKFPPRPAWHGTRIRLDGLVDRPGVWPLYGGQFAVVRVLASGLRDHPAPLWVGIHPRLGGGPIPPASRATASRLLRCVDHHRRDLHAAYSPEPGQSRGLGLAVYPHPLCHRWRGGCGLGGGGAVSSATTGGVAPV